MEIKIPDVPKDLIKQIKDGNCVVFVGAGLSQGAGLPNWTGLLQRMLNWAADHGVDMSDRAELEGYIGEGKLLMVAEEMRERLVDDDFRSFMVETFRKPGLKPTEAHRLIPGINFCAALTSNYDTLLETAYTLEWKKTPPVFTHLDCPELSAALRSNQFYILKVHGHIDRIETIILGRSDYREIIYNNREYHTYLTTLLSSKTMLFVGFSLTDPDLMMLLDELGAIFKGYTGKHYALVSTEGVGEIERRRFERDYNIHIIPYTPSAEDHPEVKAFLGELAKLSPGELHEVGRAELVKPEFGKLSNVPELPDHFLERPEYLNPIKELLLAGDSVTVGITGKTRRIGVHGMGGIGKSVLATALARDEGVRRAFSDGVIWLTIGQTPAITSRQRQLALALGDDPSPFEDEQQGKARLSEVLGDKECLIILDDVWEVRHAAAFNVLGEGCRMLITTRDARIIRSLEAVEQSLDVLSDEDALTLLAKSAGQEREELPDEAREVAWRCGNLPLALAMIGSMARGGGPDCWEGPLHKLRTGDLEKIRHEFPDYPYPELLLAIQVSVEALEADIQPRYKDFAVFPEDTPVPEVVLHTFWEPDGLDVYDSRDVLNCLVERSLARRDERGRLSLHDLQFDYVRKQAGDLKAFHERLLDAYHAKCEDGWHTGPDDGYFFQHLCYHLAEAGRAEELKKLLMDFRWMQAKLDAADVNSLIDDYHLITPIKSPLTPLYKGGKTDRKGEGDRGPDDEELKLVQGAIRLSAHVLGRDTSQLAEQLAGRLMSHDSPGIQAMVEQITGCMDRPWLRPLTASLMGPGRSLIRTLRGHTRGVNSVAVTSDGRYVISGSADSTSTVWDLETDEEIRTLQGHIGPVYSVAVTSDGRYAISGSDDRTLKVWDLETGEEKHTLQGHTDWVRSVAVTSDGRYAVSGSYDKTLKVWDLETGEEIRTLQGHTGIVSSVAVTSDGRYAISGSYDRTLKVWDLETGGEIRTLPGHTGYVLSVAVAPDGRHAVSGSDDRTLKVWDLETGSPVATFSADGPLYACAVAPDGLTIVAGGASGRVHFLRMENA
jgi:WD40 repeat protein